MSFSYCRTVYWKVSKCGNALINMNELKVSNYAIKSHFIEQHISSAAMNDKHVPVTCLVNHNVITVNKA